MKIINITRKWDLLFMRELLKIYHPINAVYWAITCGHVEIVKLLLNNTLADPSDAIQFAIKNGHLDIVKLLLNDQQVNPLNNNAIKLANEGNYFEIIKLLQYWQDSYINEILVTNNIYIDDITLLIYEFT